MRIAVVLSAYDRMSAVVDRAVTTANNKLKNFQDRTSQLADKSFRTGQQLVATGLAIGAPLYEAVQQATAFETKMVDIRKQMAEDTPAAVKAMTGEVFKLSKQLPIATNDIQDMIAAGLRMGIAQDKIVDYTKDVTKMSVAFDMVPGEIADSMGKIAGVFKIPIERVGDFADAINYLDDNTRTKGPELIEVLTRIGGAAQNLKANQAAALASTFLSLGESPETAGSAITQLMTVLSAAEARSVKTRAAMLQLGLVPGEIQKRMITDAQGTIEDVFSRIGRLDKSQQTSILSRLFGNEHIAKLQKFAGNIEEYKNQLKLVNGQEKGSMDKEYQKRIASSAAQMQVFKNRLTQIAVTAGTALLPALNSILTRLGGLIQKLADFAERHQTLVKNVLLAVGAFSALAIAGGYLSFVFGGVFKLLSIGARAVQFITASFRVLTVVWQVLRALFTVGQILTGGGIIAALILGAVLVVKYWEPIKAFFGRLWDGVKMVFFKFVNFLKFFALLPFTIFMGANGKMFEAGKNIVSSIWSGIKAFASKPVEAIKNIVQKIRNHLPFSPAKEGPLRDIHRIRLVETIADTIKPAPMVKAFKRSVNALVSATPVQGAGISAGGITIHFNPVINLSGGATKADANNIAGTLKQQILQVIRDEERRKQRVTL